MTIILLYNVELVILLLIYHCYYVFLDIKTSLGMVELSAIVNVEFYLHIYSFLCKMK